jgi:hypothetical protein
MTKKIFLTCVASASLFSGTYAQTSVAKWQPEPITIDGSADDWGSQIRLFNSDSKINYEYRNDAKNLYLIFKTNDPAMQKQLVMAGMKLKFKVKTEPKTFASITFPAMKGGMMMPHGMGGKQGGKGNRPDMSQGQPTGGQSLGKPDDMAMLPERNHKDTLALDGFRFAGKLVVSDDFKPDAILFSKTKDLRAKDMVYELCIPIREFVGNDYTLDKLADVTFQLQVQINGASESKSSRGGMKSRGGGGMGGPGGGGVMGGGPGGDMGGGGMGGPGGGEMGGGEMGERPQGDPEGEADTMSKKTFNAQFTLAVKQ